MKAFAPWLAVAAAAATAVAAPSVSDVTFSQSAGRVEISYRLLGEPGIVTVDIQTNGVSIGAENFTGVFGDVNKLVSATGETCRISWDPSLDWPNRLFPDPITRAVVTVWATNCPPDYAVVPLDAWSAQSSGWDGIRYYVSTNALPHGGLSNDVYRTTRLVLRRIHAAGVEMRHGSPGNEKGRTKNYENPRMITLSQDYWMGIYEMTQAQWKSLIGSYPATFFTAERDMRPVEQSGYKQLRGATIGVSSWPDGEDPHGVDDSSPIDSIRKRTGVKFDLPSRAQWEFACRAGANTGYYDGSNPTSDQDVASAALSLLARYRHSPGITVSSADAVASTPPSAGGTAKVGSYLPNAWGLYDMLGNVEELTLDHFHCDNDFWNKNYDIFAGQPDIDPKGNSYSAGVTEHHLAYGGAWNTETWKVRCSGFLTTWYGSADSSVKNVGFRLCAPIAMK